MHFADLRAAGEEATLAHEIACWAQHHDHPVHRKDAAAGAALMARLTDPAVPGRCLPDRARMLRYAHVLRPGFFDLAAYEPVMDSPFPSYLKNRAFQDMFRETLPCCLRAQDRHGAALGIETVNPFLDHELVEFMFRVGGKLKIRDGVTKQLLRLATVGILPEVTRTRVKKTGWNAPAHVWFSKRALGELRDLSRGLRPALLQDRGLGTAIEDLAQRSPLPVAVTLTGTIERTPETVQTAAYFVVAEALTNAAKHSEAATARVSVERTDTALAATIVDDGKGGANPNGSGLVGLQSRVRALDGRLDLISPPGGPTVVRAEIPCE